jgi:membrane-associated PAP2 superfamily phosphatase
MTLPAFLSGAVSFGFFLISLFFLRFLRETRDPLFVAFSVSFLLLGIGQIILGLGGMPDEQRSLVYLVRFTAFLLIIRAVVAKNRAT